MTGFLPAAERRKVRGRRFGTRFGTRRFTQGGGQVFPLVRSGAPGRNRTCDTRFRKPVLYPLSYEGRGHEGGYVEKLVENAVENL